MSTDTPRASRSAKILYRPFGLVSSMVGGLVAGQIFKQVYKKVSRAEHDEAPGPLVAEYPVKELLVASLVQGAIYAAVKALIDRGGARAFERWTGEWPGK